MNLLTVKEASELLRVSPTTIRRYIKSGKLEGLQYGRDMKVKQESIEKLIKESEIGGNEND